VYVPSAALDTYEADSNWSQYTLVGYTNLEELKNSLNIKEHK